MRQIVVCLSVVALASLFPQAARAEARPSVTKAERTTLPVAERGVSTAGIDRQEKAKGNRGGAKRQAKAKGKPGRVKRQAKAKGKRAGGERKPKIKAKGRRTESRSRLRIERSDRNPELTVRGRGGVDRRGRDWKRKKGGARKHSPNKPRGRLRQGRYDGYEYPGYEYAYSPSGFGLTVYLGQGYGRGKGSSFCRYGVGHPVFGRSWCSQKGFGLFGAGPGWSRTSYSRSHRSGR